MKTKEKKWIRFRIYLVAVMFVLGLGVVLGRAYQLQVLERSRLAAIAEDGYVGTVKLPPKRGTIYDRDGHELALSVEVASIYAHPHQVTEKSQAARKLAGVLKTSREKLQKLLREEKSFVWIERRIPPNQAEAIQAMHLHGIGVTPETRRYYPGKENAAHLIGFVGMDNQGLEGLERKYDRILSGSQYRLVQMRDALGRLFSISRPIASGQKPRDLILTLDKNIQYKAQKALLAAVSRSEARGGQCLVIEPETGEILAMAVVPQFNPNIFSNYPQAYWRNRTITDCFEPGSTIKAFLLAAALEEGAVRPETQFDCEQGRYKVGRRVVRDTHEHGLLAVRDIIVRSSNIGAVKIGEKLGYRTFTEYLREFGFGQKTGVDLLGERAGFVRPPSEARTIDRANLYFGQGMTTTALQLAMAMAAIANGGRLMRPYVVKAVVDETGELVSENRPQVVRRVLSERTAGTVRAILEGVVGEEGTGPRAAIEGFRVAGKTGTAQKVDPETRAYSQSKYVASFAGFVPAQGPRLLIVVIIDEPKGVSYGGLVAAPAFKEIGQWSLSHLRVTPAVRLVEGPKGGSAGEVASNPAPAVDRAGLRVDAGLLPDFTGLGMREVLKKGRSLGLRVRLKGTGLAVKQKPRPGLSLKKVDSITVNFKPPA